MKDDTKFELMFWGTGFGIVVLIVGLLFFGLPQYNVWQKGLNGQAILKEAEFTRQVRVTEAQSRLEASKLDAQSTVVKAEGQSKANDIVSKSLTAEVLQYKYIEMLEEQGNEGDRTIIYIPTDSSTGLPVSLPSTEATRLQK